MATDPKSTEQVAQECEELAHHWTCDMNCDRMEQKHSQTCHIRSRAISRAIAAARWAGAAEAVAHISGCACVDCGSQSYEGVASARDRLRRAFEESGK